MADIFELMRARSAHEVSNAKTERLEPDLEAEIIIFPGVRYDRDGVDSDQPVDKKRAVHKPKAP